MYLSELSKDRNNNLDIMRFFAAVCVIISHSIPLSKGEEYADFISVYTSGSLSIGGIAVGIFFVAGGFLISKSMERVKTAKDFFSSRCIRIFPPLIFVILISVFVLGPVLTQLPLVSYFINKNTYLYLINMILIPVHALPGVFENNIYPEVVNGPLWTLPVEFICYILRFLAFKTKFFNKKNYLYTIPLATVICALVLYLNNSFFTSVIRPVLLFYIGFGMYVLRDYIKLSAKYNFLAIIIFILLLVMKCDFLAMILIFPYIVFYLAYGCKYKFSNFSRYGEFSYGMYLWGWPIGQTVCMFAGGHMNWILNAVIVSVIAILFGVISYYAIDRNVNKIYKKIMAVRQS